MSFGAWLWAVTYTDCTGRPESNLLVPVPANCFKDSERVEFLEQNVVTELPWTESADAADLFVSAITLLELELGVLSIERKDPTQGVLLRAWMEQHVLPEFAGRTLPVDTAVAQRCARLHVPDKRSERAALIAATALVHGMTVVTRNVADFQPSGVTTLNPWESIR